MKIVLILIALLGVSTQNIYADSFDVSTDMLALLDDASLQIDSKKKSTPHPIVQKIKQLECLNYQLNGDKINIDKKLDKKVNLYVVDIDQLGTSMFGAGKMDKMGHPQHYIIGRGVVQCYYIVNKDMLLVFPQDTAVENPEKTDPYLPYTVFQATIGRAKIVKKLQKDEDVKAQSISLTNIKIDNTLILAMVMEKTNIQDKQNGGQKNNKSLAVDTDMDGEKIDTIESPIQSEMGIEWMDNNVTYEQQAE